VAEDAAEPLLGATRFREELRRNSENSQVRQQRRNTCSVITQ
jgi:hypothetical protein